MSPAVTNKPSSSNSRLHNNQTTSLHAKRSEQKPSTKPSIKLLPILQQAASSLTSSDTTTNKKPSSNKPLSSCTEQASQQPKIIKFSNLVNLSSLSTESPLLHSDSTSLSSSLSTTTTLNHSSLDGKEKQLALTMRDKKLLKQQAHMEYMESLKIYSNDIKTTRKGEAFDIEANRTISRKNELQKEMDQLTFEMKKFVYDQTVKKPKNGNSNNGNTIPGNMVTNQEVSEKQLFKIKKMMKEEYRQQGRDIKHLEEKSTYTNYKQYKNEKLMENKMERMERNQMIKNGVLDQKQLKRERLIQQQRKSSKTRKFYAKHGAPNEIGVAAVKSKYGKGGAVGKWKGGMLHIRKEDLYMLK